MAAFVHPFVPILGPELQHSNLNTEKSVNNKSKKKRSFNLFSNIIATVRNKNTTQTNNIKCKNDIIEMTNTIEKDAIKRHPFNYNLTPDGVQLFGECSSSQVYDIESCSEHKVSHFVFLYTVKDYRIQPRI